jgi:hypothetical protein
MGTAPAQFAFDIDDVLDNRSYELGIIELDGAPLRQQTGRRPER